MADLGARTPGKAMWSSWCSAEHKYKQLGEFRDLSTARHFSLKHPARKKESYTFEKQSRGFLQFSEFASRFGTRTTLQFKM